MTVDRADPADGVWTAVFIVLLRPANADRT
jgi:hypothetical protein